MSDALLRTPFPERAGAALKDTFLQEALKIATTKFIDLRKESFAGFPQGEALLRSELSALAAWHLVNIIRAHGLSTEDPTALSGMAPNARTINAKVK